jgi:hypothetical protein
VRRGGAHNASVVALFERELCVRLVPLDELSSVVRGLNAMLEVCVTVLCFRLTQLASMGISMGCVLFNGL